MVYYDDQIWFRVGSELAHCNAKGQCEEEQKLEEGNQRLVFLVHLYPSSACAATT